MGRFPDFIMIGAARAGTTAIYNYLRQCDEIFMPAVKEPNFFAYVGQELAVRGPGADFINNSVTTLEDYHALFAGAPMGAITGEASPLYLYEPAAPVNIARLCPNARLIVILRNPIEQAFSHFLYASKLAIETERDFVKALRLEESRLAQGWQPLFGYSRFPAYGTQLQRYFERFEREQIFIRLYDDFLADPARVMTEMAAFIGVSQPFVPDMSRRHNSGAVPRNQAFQNFLMRPNPVTKAISYVVPKETRWAIRDQLAKLNSRKDDAMPAAARRILRDRLSDEIELTSQLVGRDLSHWQGSKRAAAAQ